MLSIFVSLQDVVFPSNEELAKVLGVTKDEVSGLVKEGKVGFKEVEQAFKNMTSESGSIIT